MALDQEISEALKIYFKNTFEVELKKIPLNVPKQKEHGDFSSNIVMMNAKKMGLVPRNLAQKIVDECFFPDFVEKVEIAGPGFLNFFVSNTSVYQTIQEIHQKKSDFGKNSSGENKKTLVEFVSANPTGPLTVGHGRNAVLGDTFSRILEANGYKVDREYYFNNAGRQMRVLGHSVFHRYTQLYDKKHEMPDGHYMGEYIIDIAKKVQEKYNDFLLNDMDNEIFKKTAENEIFVDIKKTLERMGIIHDTFYNEQELYDTGKIADILQTFKEKNLSYEKDGAVWLKTSELGFEQDRVIVKASGEPTYRLPDMAYHKEKFERGYDSIIDIFGADHIDAYPDVLAAVKNLGYDTDLVKVIIYQFVTLIEKGEVVKMSTRAANFVTLDELMDEVGADVVRYFINMRSVNTHLNFDLDLAKSQSDDNPVYYVQYAHARISSILRRSKSNNLSSSDKHLELLTHDAELKLIKHLAEFPKLIKTLGKTLEQQKLCNYAYDLAGSYHKFNHECRVLDEEKIELSEARLYLIEATKIVLANAFRILGISAPEKM
jgi:arginyl-tRNA synthetase